MSQTTPAAVTGISLPVHLTRNLMYLLNFGSTGLVAFRQHLQNLARTKGFLELNKAQIVLGDGGLPTVSPQDYPFSHQVR